MNSETMHYASYLVRIWRDRESTVAIKPHFHAEVEHIQTGQRRHFHTPADLYTFLQQQPSTGEQDEAIDD